MTRGVELREKSIRLAFAVDGVTQRHTLMLNGKPLPPTPANIKYAHRLAAEVREKIGLGTFVRADYFPASGDTGSLTTLSTQLDTWIGTQRIEASTKAGYESVCRWWKSQLGDKPLKHIKHGDVLTAIATMADLSGKTVNNRVSVLREALSLAVLDKLITENPVANVPSAKWQRKPVDPFTAEEVEAIIADMASHYDPQVANYCTFRFFTGLRTGESFAIRWANVSSDHIVVQESVVKGIDKASTKTNNARTVLLNSRALAALKAQKPLTFLKGAHVFNDPRGGRWMNEPQWRYYWVPTLKRLGIRHRPPYNSRHTYATAMLMAGMMPAFCARQMGHSVDVFLRTYASWIPGAGDAAEMLKLEATIDRGNYGVTK